MSIIIACNDGVQFTIDIDLANKINYIKEIIEKKENNIDEPIILDINSSTFTYVIEYCEYHRNVIEYDNYDDIEYDDYDNIIKTWDKEYLKRFKCKEDLFDTAIAANILKIRNLLNLISRTIIDDIRDKTVEEIREYFNIPFPDDEIPIINKRKHSISIN